MYFYSGTAFAVRFFAGEPSRLAHEAIKGTLNWSLFAFSKHATEGQCKLQACPDRGPKLRAKGKGNGQQGRARTVEAKVLARGKLREIRRGRVPFSHVQPQAGWEGRVRIGSPTKFTGRMTGLIASSHKPTCFVSSQKRWKLCCRCAQVPSQWSPKGNQVTSGLRKWLA